MKCKPRCWGLFCKLAMVPTAALSLARAWDSDVRLTLSEYYAAEPAIAAKNGKVVVAWEDYRVGNDEIFIKVSNDNGQTWADDFQISFNDTSSLLPDIAISDNNDIHVVWEDLSAGKMSVFYLCYSSDGSMSAATKVNGSTAYAGYPAVCTYQNQVYLVWEDYRHGNDEIYFRRYDPSSGWSPEVRITNDDSTSWGADMAVDSTGKLYVTWFDYRTGNDDIMASTSGNGGDTWSSPVNLSKDPKNSWDPHIAVGTDNLVHVAWYSYIDAQNAYEVSYAKFDGSAWSERVYISAIGHDSKLPDVAATRGSVFVTWEDFRDANDEVYVIQSNDNGKTWQNEKRLTYNDKDSFGATLAADGKYVYVTWFDYRDAVDQIYFKRTVLDNTGDVAVFPLSSCNRRSKAPIVRLSNKCLCVQLPDPLAPVSSLRVCDVFGKMVVFSRRNTTQRIEVSTHYLPQGIYFITVGAYEPIPLTIIR